MTSPDMIPEIKITPPDGELLYISPYTGEMTNIDTRVAVQGAPGFSRVVWDGVHDLSPGVVYDGSYPPTYDVREKATIDEYGTSQITHGYSKVDWDGVHDSLRGFVYDSSSPLTYNVRGGLLYVPDGGDVIDSAAECKWKEVKELYIADIENSTEPSDLKNTKANIRKIKPDVNSKLKRV